MRSGELAKLLDTTKETLGNWVKHPLLEEFFSPGARLDEGRAYRTFNQDDQIIANTIRHLRNDLDVTDWDEIAKRLSDGFRYNEFPTAALNVDKTTIPRPLAEQSVKAAATLAELNEARTALEERNERIAELESTMDNLRDHYEGKLEELRQAHKSEIERLYREIMELYRKIGQLEAGRGDDD